VRYLVVGERGPTSFGASVPDLPPYGTVGGTRAAVLRLIREKIESKLDALGEHGEPVPHPSSTSKLAWIEAA